MFTVHVLLHNDSINHMHQLENVWSSQHPIFVLNKIYVLFIDRLSTVVYSYCTTATTKICQNCTSNYIVFHDPQEGIAWPARAAQVNTRT